MKQPTEAAITVLANWWFDKFLGPKHDNGATEPESVMANVAMNMLADMHPVNESQRQPFIDAMKVRCMGEDASISFHGLGVDYHPGATLAGAMSDAGIDHSRASIKTSVSIYGRGVVVGEGYGAPNQTLCDMKGFKPSRRWVLKTCTNGRTCTQYSYCEYEHHGKIASFWEYDDAGEGAPYEEMVEVISEGVWVPV